MEGGGGGGAAAQSPGPIASVPFYINAQSFDSAFPDYGAERIIEDAARQWNWAGGSRFALDYVGTTTIDPDGGCPLASDGGSFNIIYAQPGPGIVNGNGGYNAYTIPCGANGTQFAIEVFPQQPPYLTDNETAGQIDLQTIVQHEFGHALGWGPIHPDPTQWACNVASPWCVLNRIPCPNDRSRRFFCVNEIDGISSLDGVASATPQWLLQPNGWPGFSATGWETGPLFQENNYGYGLGAISPADGDRTFFWTDVTTSPHPVDYCAPYASHVIPCWQNTIPYSSSDMRPAVAYDTNRGNWWVFWRNRPGSGSLYPTDGPAIIYSISSDLATWSTPAELWFSNIYTPMPLSRLPVGAAYDNFSDSLVVVFANWNAPNGDTTAGNDFTCTNTYGCSGELNLATVPAGAAQPITFNGPWDLGVIATTPPAVACEYSQTDYECQVLLNGETWHRNILSFTFGLYQDGSLYNVPTPIQDMGGWTDDPIGLTFNGVNKQGDFVAMITEANPQGYVSFMEKPLVEDNWGPWQYPWGSNGQYGPQTHLGPVIKISPSNSDYEAIYAQ